MKYYEWFEMMEKQLTGKELYKFYESHDIVTWTYGYYDDNSMAEDVTAVFNSDLAEKLINIVDNNIKSRMVQEFFNDYR